MAEAASAPPLPSAVVVPVRRTARGLEVLWLRRADHLSFLAGFWAFPGGRLEAADLAGAPGDAAMARRVCAVRELAEETGIMVPEAALAAAGEATSPGWAKVRYETAYFVAEIPGDIRVELGPGGEHTAWEWITAASARARWASGERVTSALALAILDAIAAGPIAQAPARVAAVFARDDLYGPYLEVFPGVGVCAQRSPTLPPATHTNAYVLGTDELVVIDPASPWDDEQAIMDRALDMLAARGRRVREIWLTHHHVDHVSGAAHLAARLGVPVAAHPRTAELVAGRIAVARTIEDGDVTVFAAAAGVPERRVRAIFTPGHAPGHLCFLEETTGALVAGDMVAAIGTIIIDPDEGDMAEYLASLARMDALDARVLLPAHGPPITAPRAKLAEYTAHRLRREARVLEALVAAAGVPATPLALVAVAYADTPAAPAMLAARSLEAHLGKLVRDGRVSVEDGRYRLA